MDANTKQVLIRARELIVNPEHWTREAQARNRVGTPVNALSSDAYSFCAYGALVRVCGEMRIPIVEMDYMRAAMERYNKYHRFTSLVLFNDAYTHADVIDLFDKAIEE